MVYGGRKRYRDAGKNCTSVYNSCFGFCSHKTRLSKAFPPSMAEPLNTVPVYFYQYRQEAAKAAGKRCFRR